MAVKDHGLWEIYTPVEHPADAPRNAAFCRRADDGFDWYEYVNVEEGNPFHKGRKKQFGIGTVKCVIDRDADGNDMVRTAAVDETRLFPEGGRLIELLDETREQNEAALIEEFCNHRIDLKTGKVGERWKPKAQPDKITPLLEQILARLERLENR